MWEDPSSPFTVLAKASGDVEAYTATRFGFPVSLGSKYVTLLKALLFTEKNYGKADFSFDAQTSALTTTTYSGPVWDAKIGAELDFDPSFSGAVTQVMGKFGVGIPAFTPQNLTSAEKTLIGSPTQTLTTKGTCPLTLTSTISDANAIPLDYGGESVDFVALAGPPGAPLGKLGTGTVSGAVGNQIASYNWTPTFPTSGDYKVIALLQGSAWSKIGLPYASQILDVQVMPCGQTLFVANSGNSTVTTYAAPYTGTPTATISAGISEPKSLGVNAAGVSLRRQWRQ